MNTITWENFMKLKEQAEKLREQVKACRRNEINISTVAASNSWFIDLVSESIKLDDWELKTIAVNIAQEFYNSARFETTTTELIKRLEELNTIVE